ncbi:MAG: ester cyclase [Candidatus Udaeobacter sp.]
MHPTVKAARVAGAVHLPMIFTAPFTLLHVPSKLMKIIRTVSACSLLLVASSLFGSSLQEQNKAIAKRAFEEILSQGDFELAEQLYAKDFINHGIHSNASLEEDQAALKGWHQAFSDISIVPEKLIAEGDLVTIYWIARGTNTGTGNGLPATGKKAELAGITIWRIVDGKIKEEWSAFDQLSMMQQLGLLPTDKQ